MQQIGERYHKGGSHRPVTLIVDEFASFATPDFIEFMDRARGAGVGIVFAHQSRSDLDAISPEFKGRIEANANTTILSGVRDPADAEHFASMVGTRSLNKTTVQTNRLFGLFDVETGLRSNREAEEFIVHPNELKALNQGRVFVLARTIDARHGVVKVPHAADPFPVSAPTCQPVEPPVLRRLPGVVTEPSEEQHKERTQTDLRPSCPSAAGMFE
jgi:type IV secretory pathway TraG/TraD family ATPase VirD4